MPRPTQSCPACGQESREADICTHCWGSLQISDKSADTLNYAWFSYDEGWQEDYPFFEHEESEPEKTGILGIDFPSEDDTARGNSVTPLLQAAKDPERPYCDAQDRAEIARDKAARRWDEIAARAQAIVEANPFTLDEGGGYCFLKRWENCSATLRLLNPDEPPRIPPVFGSIATLGGKPFIVPIRRKGELQKVLDEHKSDLKLGDLVRSHSRPGRRRRKEERKEISEWERDRDEILRLRMRLRGRYPQGDVPTDDPDSGKYTQLRIKWHKAKKCRRTYCFHFIPRGDRKRYCTSACKQRAYKARRSY